MFDDFIIPDNYNTLLTDELNSLDSSCSKTTSSSSSNDPFINNRDDSSDVCHSPHLLSPGLSKVSEKALEMRGQWAGPPTHYSHRSKSQSRVHEIIEASLWKGEKKDVRYVTEWKFRDAFPLSVFISHVLSTNLFRSHKKLLCSGWITVRGRAAESRKAKQVSPPEKCDRDILSWRKCSSDDDSTRMKFESLFVDRNSDNEVGCKNWPCTCSENFISVNQS